jgi:hypothetical protein
MNKDHNCYCSAAFRILRCPIDRNRPYSAAILIRELWFERLEEGNERVNEEE